VSQSKVRGRIAAAAFIGTGHRLIVLDTVGQDGTSATIFDARTGKRCGGWTAYGACSLSPDGSLVAVVSGKEVRLHEADGRFIKALPGEFSAADFSVDGSWLTATGSGGMTIFDRAGQIQGKWDTFPPSGLRWLGLLPDRSRAIQVRSDTASISALDAGSRLT